MPTFLRRASGYTIPTRWPRPSQMVWPLVAGAVLATAGAVWNDVLSSRRLVSSRTYVGQLSPDTDPVVISLPRGAVLDEVLIAPDEDIRRGQTLATLDADAMARAAAALEQEIFHDDILRSCLIDEVPPRADLALALPDAAREAFHLAVQECQGQHDARAGIDRRRNAELARLEEEQALIARYIAALEEPATGDASERAQDSRQALALALLGNRLEGQMSRARLDADREVATWNDARLTRVRALAEATRRKSAARDRLRDLVDSPRLMAPRSGRVTRVRSFASETALAQDIELIEMQSAGTAGYVAWFDVPHHELDGIEVGDRIRLRMLGLMEEGPVLFGRIGALNTQGGTTVRATVDLEEGSVDLLDDPRSGLALRGRGTASLIRVEKDSVRMRDLLQARIRGDLLGGARPWIARRVAALAERISPVPPG